MKLLMAAIAFIVAGTFPASAYTLTEHELQVVRTGLGHEALVGLVKALEYEGNNVLIRGYANPKDESGQYVGERIFYRVLLGQGDAAFRFVLFNAGTTADDAKMTEGLCRERGITF